jgi:hypothetical protein
MPTRYYSNTAADTTLSTSMTNVQTTITVVSASGFPSSFPFTLVVEPGAANAEIVTVTSLSSGTTYNITRGVDGTSAVAHTSGVPVRHMITARDFTEWQTHTDATSAHGVAGAVVGTTDTQTLSGKTLSSPTLSGTMTGGTLSPSVYGNIESGTATGSATANVTVNLTAGRFSSTPAILATARQSTWSGTTARVVQVGNESTSSFTFFSLAVTAGSVAGNASNVSWIAITA